MMKAMGNKVKDKVRFSRDVRNCCSSLTGVPKQKFKNTQKNKTRSASKRGRKSRQIYLPSVVSNGHYWNTDEVAGKETKGKGLIYES